MGQEFLKLCSILVSYYYNTSDNTCWLLLITHAYPWSQFPLPCKCRYFQVTDRPYYPTLQPCSPVPRPPKDSAHNCHPLSCFNAQTCMFPQPCPGHVPSSLSPLTPTLHSNNICSEVQWHTCLCLCSRPSPHLESPFLHTNKSCVFSRLSVPSPLQLHFLELKYTSFILIWYLIRASLFVFLFVCWMKI